ncbi:MAG: DUF1963 domain-containing protein, partial [Cyanobacteria bacterium J06559_3]
ERYRYNALSVLDSIYTYHDTLLEQFDKNALRSKSIDLMRLTERFYSVCSKGEPYHRLLGHPMDIGSGKEVTLHKWNNDFSIAPSDWKVLLTLTSDFTESREYQWGSMGNLYHFIRQQDLEQRIFSRACPLIDA